jgi:iron complex outermembrane receptor protein
VDDKLDTFEIDFQHGLSPLARHEILWGITYRFLHDHLKNTAPALFAFRPASRDLSAAGIFLQDEVRLRHDLDLILGLKAEHNRYTDMEYLPSVSLAWQPSTALLWGSWSRVVRAPSRVDREFYVPGNPPHVVLAGGPDFRSEVAHVFEVGYRDQPFEFLSWAVTGFHHDLDRLRSTEPTPSGPQLANGIEGSLWGMEVWSGYRVTDRWRLFAGYVRQDLELEVDEGSGDPGSFAALGNDPEHYWQIRSGLDVSRHLEFDAAVRYMGSLPHGPVPSYTAVDARIGLRFPERVALSLLGRNLLDPGHVEWGNPTSRAEFGRFVQLKLTWQM